jgi:DNA transposition AAA+ family ATPase
MSTKPKLEIVGGQPLWDEELRLWLENFIKEHPHLPTGVLERIEHINASKTTLDAYLQRIYFIPKEQGGMGVQPGGASKLEAKIRAYRERVEGTTRHDYSQTFVETGAWQQFRHACHTAITENAIVVVYARPGVGKSRALQQYSLAELKTPPIQILCSANITPRYFVQKLAQDLRLDDRVPTARLEDNIAERLKRNPRPIFVDQANYLTEKSLGTVCYLWEVARVPIVLVGTKDLYELFTTSRLTEDVRAQLSSRVAMHYPLVELSAGELKAIVRRALGDQATDAAVAKILSVTGGNFRHVDMLLPRARELATRNQQGLNEGSIQLEEIIETAGRRLMVG